MRRLPYKHGRCEYCWARVGTGMWECSACERRRASIPMNPHYAVARAIRRKELAPAYTKLCVDCGIRAHCYDHRDYRKPLDVEPVCTSCNKRRGKARPLSPYLFGVVVNAFSDTQNKS